VDSVPSDRYFSQQALVDLARPARIGDVVEQHEYRCDRSRFCACDIIRYVLTVAGWRVEGAIATDSCQEEGVDFADESSSPA